MSALHATAGKLFVMTNQSAILSSSRPLVHSAYARRYGSRSAWINLRWHLNWRYWRQCLAALCTYAVVFAIWELSVR
jgi:hypothetical protein